LDQTVGASRNKGALPTGNAVDTVTVGDKTVEITICDVANIVVFVRASDMGITATESAKAISADSDLIARCKELRGKAAKLVGMCANWEKVDQQAPGLPLVCMVAAPESEDGDLTARLLLNNSCHDSMAGTGAVCIGACSRVEGSVVNRVMRAAALDANVLQISHPLGIMPIWVDKPTSESTGHAFNTLSFVRTSRRIMEGVTYVPEEVWDGKL
jgi:2-methylaconitate cis-trans-isomerase PrpF